MLYENDNIIEEYDTVLVGVITHESRDFDHEMQELESLADACNMNCVAIMQQQLAHPDPATCIGSGKLYELADLVSNIKADYVIFSENLSPAQLKNIQKLINAEVLDRTSLILRIFATRARTREAKLQVESANLKYMLPRLVGMRSFLSRQGGGSGSLSNKGQGEKQLELDRRHIEKRITELSRELEAISHDREIQRQRRRKGTISQVSLVGYTNAGKSTLMNVLVNKSGADEDKRVFEKNMLFATLDTTIRRIELGDKRDFLVADTVGFIDKLPTGLVKAFRSTLEEVCYANLLLIVVDASDEYCAEHIKVTEDTLNELGASNIARIYVYNKCDMALNIDGSPKYEKLPLIMNDRIYISAKNNIGIDELIKMVQEKLYAGNRMLKLLVPYSDGHILNIINEKTKVFSREYLENGVCMLIDCPQELADQMRVYSYFE